MRRILVFTLLIAAGFLFCAPLRAQWISDRYQLTDAERQELTAGRDRLRKAYQALADQAARSGIANADQLADAEIYLDAVDRNLRQNLFFSQQYVDLARACLKEGASRVNALSAGRSPWERQHGLVVLGYRSRVDGSAQPFVVRVPSGHDYDLRKPGRLDIHLHGRMGAMNELGYLNFVGWDGASYRDEEKSCLVLHPYGRGNNGWHFAGETDVFEALAAMRRRFHINPDYIILRGFSMGGHGCWHLGLQHPGIWAAMSPGAGFVSTRSFEHLGAGIPPWEESLFHLYDAIDYAANAADVPVLAYTGDKDPAIEQHRSMIEAMKKEGVPFKEYIGPDTAHRYEPETRKVLMADLDAAYRRAASPTIDFVTYTLRFPDCKWLRLEGLGRQWSRAEIHARFSSPRRLEIVTRNVSAFSVNLPTALLPAATRLGAADGGLALSIDGDEIRGGAVLPNHLLPLVLERGRWLVGEQTGLRKRPELQGPIDDALFGPLLAVTPTGTPWSAPMHGWLMQELQRFRDGWDEFFRGTLPEKTDRAVTAEDIAEKNLYLFGDPGSNAVLRRLLPRLPLQWKQDTITIAGRSFSTADHLPMLVFPNPESPSHYVVVDTGFTFSRADWRGSNALQYPHLPDYAVIRYNPAAFQDDRRKDTELAGFFDERWKLRWP